MERLEPKLSTVKKLFALSGNKCAFEDCNNNLIDDNALIGEICHIEAAEPGGPRWNKDSDNEYRRDFDNLILMCPNCHKKIDSDEEKFTKELLAKWKNNHYNKYKNNKLEIPEEFITTAIQLVMKQDNNSNKGVQFNNQGNNISVNTQIGIQNNYSNSAEPEIIDYGSNYRKVYRDFRDEIKEYIKNRKPIGQTTIRYKQNELRDKYSLPLKYLRFRKENGRIKVEVKSLETQRGYPINELEEQDLLKTFLIENDPSQTKKLKKLIENEGQTEPAIITCDGFLINGNRRRAVFDTLYHEKYQTSEFETMDVIILDEKVELIDIEKIENRYQLQDDGKSEYSGLNRALSIRDKIKNGYSLEAQLQDDANYKNLPEKDFKNAVRKYNQEFLCPLDCVDRYLKYFQNENLYELVSENVRTKDGRWYSFIEYSKFYYGTLMDEKRRISAGIEKEDISKIEDVAFKLIRKKDFKNHGKLLDVIRKLNKCVTRPEARKHLFRMVKEVSNNLPPEELIDKETHKPIEDKKIIEKKWGKYFENEILQSYIQAEKIILQKDENEKPIEILTQALKKLEHEKLIVENILSEDIDEALSITKKIINKGSELEQMFDKQRYNLKKLSKK